MLNSPVFLIDGIQLNYLHDSANALTEAVCQKTGIANPKNFIIWRRSLDARGKSNIHYCYSVLVGDPGKYTSAKETQVIDAQISSPKNYNLPNPVVVGFGPAGIFAALYLAKAGLCPIIIERGAAMEARVKAVTDFWKTGTLLENNNVQFGEGGAGTFSDGKLTSRGKDPISRAIKQVFVNFGAPDNILYEAKPHIGTDILRTIIPKIRAEIIGLGGQFFFDTKLEGIVHSNKQVCAVKLSNGAEIKTSSVFLGIGHSARDTFAMLQRSGVQLEAKPFAVGMRIEHSQEIINSAIYGKYANYNLLPPGEYSLAHHVGTRGVYSFCMCPGGEVVNASSEPTGTVVNGMSWSRRNSKFANSALVVTVNLSDFASDNPLNGMYFQQNIEAKALAVAGRNIPASDLNSFINKAMPTHLPVSSCQTPLQKSNVAALFPAFVQQSMLAAFPHFEQVLPKFISSNPLLLAPETRTSSPVRIVRHLESRESVSHAKLYPIGEGAGYAGGIMSAAVDGWRSAEQYVLSLS